MAIHSHSVTILKITLPNLYVELVFLDIMADPYNSVPTCNARELTHVVGRLIPCETYVFKKKKKKYHIHSHLQLKESGVNNVFAASSFNCARVTRL